jgi:hypothetical protein
VYRLSSRDLGLNFLTVSINYYHSIMSLMRARGSAYIRVGRLPPAPPTVFVRMLAQAPVKTTPSDAPTTESSVTNKESPSESMARHQPDYDAIVDHATSYESSAFSTSLTDLP